MIEITLPFPPTVNTYWRNIVVKGRSRTLISKKGRQYSEDVAKLCLGLRGSFPDQRLTVTLDLYTPDRRRRDIDNLVKAVFDSLTKAGVWGDDEQVDSLHVHRREIVKGGVAEVKIMAL